MNATSIQDMEEWKNCYGETPALETGNGKRENLKLRLCHFLQLPEPVDLNIDSKTSSAEAYEKMKGMVLRNLNAADTANLRSFLDQMKTKQLEKITEENEENSDGS